MKMILNRIIITFLITNVCANYWEKRRMFVHNEESMTIGASIKLNEKEAIVNKVLMSAKNEEMSNLKKSSPGRHSFKLKEDVEESEVFKIIKRMPKGAALNFHDLTISSIDYLLFNITYRDHLYICTNNDDIKFKFSLFDPIGNCWKSVEVLRQEERFVEDFDNWLRRNLSLDIEKKCGEYIENKANEKEVSKIIEIIKSLVLYRPVFFDYIYRAIEDLYKDNIMYIELQGFLPELYDLDGTYFNSFDTLKLLEQVNDHFVRDHPDFIGFKYIYTPKTNSTMKQNLQLFEDMKQSYPNLIGGFDIAFHDRIETIIDQLLKISENTNIFFHFDESKMNVIDAILLNTTRIGYSYEIFKHPLVLEEIKRRQIAIEVCPISKDLQSLSIGYLLATGYPVVISSCDAFFKDIKGLSYYYYEAFMSLANENADLKMLKQLFINTLLYNSLTTEGKLGALLTWEQKWNLFLDEFAMDNNYVE